MPSFNIDGISYSYEGDDSLSQAVEKAIKSRNDNISRLKDGLSSAEKSSTELQARSDALAAEKNLLQKKVEELSDPKRLETAAKNRAKLIAKAVFISGNRDFSCDGSDFEVKMSALRVAGHKLPEFGGKSDEYKSAYVAAVFDSAKPSKTESIVAQIVKSDSHSTNRVDNAIDKVYKSRFGLEK